MWFKCSNRPPQPVGECGKLREALAPSRDTAPSLSATTKLNYSGAALEKETVEQRAVARARCQGGVCREAECGGGEGAGMGAPVPAMPLAHQVPVARCPDQTPPVLSAHWSSMRSFLPRCGIRLCIYAPLQAAHSGFGFSLSNEVRFRIVYITFVACWFLVNEPHREAVYGLRDPHLSGKARFRSFVRTPGMSGLMSISMSMRF
ncbi:hypothetical protein B0H12DRAFT_1224511 [Mycena haematopus]|nr:hypothetical protein B0H12DRAFT_1224511 [Mycena haematopus]